MKTVKGKVVAGTLALTLFAGAGVAFGASDAGTNLLSWYNSKFGVAQQEVIGGVKQNVTGKITKLAGEYQGLKTGATNSINKTGADEVAAKNTAIKAEAQEHIDAVNAQKNEIAGYMEVQFNQLYDAANIIINTTGAEAVKYAEGDLEKHTVDKGSAALGSLNEDLNATTAKAVNDLTKAINDAKSSLQTQLNSEKTATKNEIIAAIDAKIIELRNTVTEKRNELVVIQQDLITKKATELEGQAFAKLDSIVSGINK